MPRESDGDRAHVAARTPIQLALRGIGNSFGWFDYSKVMASSVLALIPPLIIFFIFQRNLVRDIALTGIKG